MMRRIAVVGDRLENGGEILSYAGPPFTLGDDASHQVALICGEAYCEACKSTGVIAKAGDPRRIEFMGETAADGDIVLCNCPTPPRIVAKLAGESWCDDEAESVGKVASHRTVGGGVSTIVTGAFDEQVRGIGRGRLEGYPYYVQMADGRIEAGRLDSTGTLSRVQTGSAADDYAIYWGDEALVRQDGE